MAMTRLMTADELAHLPDDGFRHELLRGELIHMPPPGYRHGKRVSWISWHFVNYVNTHGGEVTTESGYYLRSDPDTVFGPDIAYVRPDRLPPMEDQDQYVYLAPDVVVEVLSPSDRPGYLRDKVAEYRRSGVRLIIMADAFKRRVTVHRADGSSVELNETDTFDGGDVMPGFRLPVSEFFR